MYIHIQILLLTHTHTHICMHIAPEHMQYNTMLGIVFYFLQLMQKTKYVAMAAI